MKRLILMVCFVNCCLLAQEDKTKEEMVLVPKKYVSTEGLTHTQTSKSEWIGIGREIGIATREGLDAVIGSAEKFGTTKVGTFIMCMVAWKIIGKDLLGIVLGVPIYIMGLVIWWWAVKRLFLGYKVLDREEGKAKTYKIERYKFNGNDARFGAGIICTLYPAVWSIVMLTIIFH